MQRRRKHLDLTQKELARRVGCSVATVRKLEGDERRPSKATAAALARALGVPDVEHAAFVGFARAGWADDPPPNPRPDLERPWRRLGSNGPRARPVPAPPPAATATRAVHVPLLGREGELARLEAALDEALAGSGSVVLVAGEAGHGKTFLMSAFAARAQAAHPELLVAVGACNAFSGGGDPFLPFRQVLKQLTGDIPDLHEIEPFEQARIARLRRFAVEGGITLLEQGPHLVDTFVPGARLRARLERERAAATAPWDAAQAVRDAQNQAGTGTLAQGALRSEATAVLTTMARHAPLLLLLDDLHWADPSSLELLLQLSRAVPAHPVLVVGALRPVTARHAEGDRHPLASSVHELERQFGDVVLDLGRSDGRAFLEALLDSEPNALGPAFREALWRQTAGQPLFTIELLRAMQERGDLVRDADGRWVEALELRWDALPARVAGALGERIDRLPPFAQEVLRVASVEGEVFTAEVIARVLGEDPLTVARAAGTELAADHRLIVPESVARGADGRLSRYRFRHNLIQRYAYDRIDMSERRYLHEAVADATVEAFGDEADPVAVALHYARAAAPERAAPFQRKAARRARDAGALVDAADAYRAVLENGALPGRHARAELQRELGDVLALLGERDAELGLLEQALAGFEET
ncbi:MAG: AAA family ATPase, partial [Deinococcales bacterium]